MKNMGKELCYFLLFLLIVLKHSMKIRFIKHALMFVMTLYNTYLKFIIMFYNNDFMRLIS